MDERRRAVEGLGVTELVGALHGGIARYNGCRTVKFTTTPFDSIWLIDPAAHEDERGFFARTWCRRELERYGLKSCRCTT